MSQGPGPEEALRRVLSQDRGRLVAALIRELRDFQLAEDVLQDAAEAALVHWARSGIPARPEAWLLKVARRKAIDVIRRQVRLQGRTADIARLAEADTEAPPEIPDERLRLIFTCCHPALDPKSRVALTLRTLGGLSTPEVARAFLDAETTMGQRLSRAKAKIRDARIAYAVPGPEDWAERLGSVLSVIYLIFNQGYSANGPGETVRAALCGEAIWLARLVDSLRPAEPEVEGLLALMLITHARSAARGGEAYVPLHLQDRRLWDAALLEDGLARLDRAVARGAPGPYQIKAAISACHMAERVDWRQIVMLYDSLLRYEPTDVVRLNRAVALAELAGPQAALGVLDPLAEGLGRYQPYHAARADLLVRAGCPAPAIIAYDTAIGLTDEPQLAQYLTARRDAAKKRAEREARPKSNREV